MQNAKNNNSKLKAQNSKPQLKTLKLTFGHPEGALSYCHPERSEGSHAKQVRDSSLTLRMTSSLLSS
jgi:hypothetical protein